MTDDRLIAIIEEFEALATNQDALDEQADAIDRYLGKPYGDEQEGRSQIVMRDIADTVEWIKPALLKVFASGDEIVTFTPQGPEDEQQATQESDYCNYVLMNKNSGFMLLHDWFHDALVQKNGYVVCTYEEEKRVDKSRYDHLSPEEATMLLQDGSEIVESKVEPEGIELVLRNEQQYGCLKIRCIPPERVKVAHTHPDIDLANSDFVELIEYVTISALREQGYDVDDDISDDTRRDGDAVEVSRRENKWANEDNETGDPATRTVKARKIWIRVDQDGDGKAELRYIVMVGKTILENEEDDIIPVACLTSVRIPHEHMGLSVADLVDDLQRIRTVLMRGFLDSMYLANNGRYGVDVTTVNIDDLLTSRPGGIVRVNGSPGTAIKPLLHPQESGAILQAVEMVDSIRENRTGVTRYNQGIDANSLNKTASGITQIMNASQQRIEMVARIFAETGVKSLMRIVQAMSIKNGRKEEIVKLRNNWVPVNPSSWKRRYDMTVSVGLGVGNKDQNLMHLQQILLAQKEGLAIGVATPKNVYNALAKLTQNAGFKNVDEFWTDPEKAPPQQPQIPPEVQKEQMRIQADQQKFQAETHINQEKQQQEMQREAEKALFDSQQAEADRQAEYQRAIDVERVKQEGETERKAMELQAQREGVAVGAQVNFRQPELDNVVQTMGNSQNQIAAMVQQMAAQNEQSNQLLMAMLEQLSRPKSVIRGPDGRVAGVQ